MLWPQEETDFSEYMKLCVEQHWSDVLMFIKTSLMLTDAVFIVEKAVRLLQ